MIVKNEPMPLETSDHCHGCIHEMHCKVKIGEMCPGSEREIPDEGKNNFFDGGEFDI